MKALCTLLLPLLFSLSLEGQRTRVINFGEDEANEDYEYKYNIIKTSPSAFLFGRQPFEYEREITDYLSLQAGIGFTFSSALSGLSTGLYSEILDEGESNRFCNSTQWGNQDYCDDLGDADIRTGKIGMIMSFSPRLWFDSDGMDGSYIAPVVRYSTYKNNVQQVEEGVTSLVRLPNSFDLESAKNVDLVVHYGYQFLNERITWEYFVGLGVRRQNQIRQDLGTPNNRFRNGTAEENSKSVLVELGIRIGFRL